MCSDSKMINSDFRTTDQEVLKLLEECGELRRTLQTISAQVSRIEKRVKSAFPVAAKMVEEKKRAFNRREQTLAPEQALERFDQIVKIAAAGATSEAERLLESQSAADLLSIAREVGISFPTNKPSIRAMREGISGKVRESLLLSRHSNRT